MNDPKDTSTDEKKLENSRLYNASLAKGLQVLAAFAHDKRSMNLPEMAAATNITKSAAQRSAHTLEKLGYLHKDTTSKRYTLTPKVLQLGCGYISTNSLIERANPYLQELSAKCGETVNLSELFQDRVIFTARFTSPKHITVHMPLGSSLPIYCTASGRAILSTFSIQEARSFLDRVDIKPYTPSTITDQEEILRHISQATNLGFATAVEEYYRGDINIASPILGSNGKAIGSVNISAPMNRWSVETMTKELGPLILETVRAISSFNRQPD